MNKNIRVRFSTEAFKIYKKIKEKSLDSKRQESLLKAINKYIMIIKKNIYFGIPISKDKISLRYKTELGINNLFRIKLPFYWNMFYTVKDGDPRVLIVGFVLG